MKEIKAYQCDHCNKYYKHKSSARKHEKQCFYNPDNKACITCNNFKTDYETIYVRPHGDQNYGDADYDVRYNYCEHDMETLNIYGLDYRGKECKRFQTNCEHWKPIEIEEQEDDVYE